MRHHGGAKSTNSKMAATGGDLRRLMCFTACLQMYITAVLCVCATFIHQQERQRAARMRRLRLLRRHLAMNRPLRHRRMWMKARSTRWYDHDVIHRFDDTQWRENFRVTRTTAERVCRLVRPLMNPNEVTVRAPLALEKRVLIALYMLANCRGYGAVGTLFGCSKASVHNCVYAFCRALMAVKDSIIHVPSTEEATRIARRIELKHHFPQVYGAIDATHIPIRTSNKRHQEYINEKRWESYVLQAVVDDNLMFRNISCKMPGSVRNDTALRESRIYKAAMLNTLPSAPVVLAGKPVDLMLLGDPAYPLRTWLAKGYAGHVTPQQESFNVYLSSARTMVEDAFDRLKARWRVLQKRCDIAYTFMPTVVAACCVLHNICEEEKDFVPQHWLDELHAQALPEPRRHRCTEPDGEAAVALRDHLTMYLADKFPLRQSAF